jgi:AcrR family transcriptional regulator
MPRGEFDRSLRKQATRTRLLEAAARVYAREGFAGATLDDVAREAGLTKGALYGHFGSKNNLLVALIEEHLAAEIATQVSLFDRDETTWKRPFSGSDRWMEELDETPEAFQLLVEFWLAATRDEDMRERVANGFEAVRQMFSGFISTSASDADLDISPQGTGHFADVSLALSLGMAMVHAVDPDSSPPELLGTALSIFIRALERDPELRADIADPQARRRDA